VLEILEVDHGWWAASPWASFGASGDDKPLVTPEYLAFQFFEGPPTRHDWNHIGL
jgi:hypothetical protein